MPCPSCPSSIDAVVVAGPSGAGKGTIIRKLMELFPNKVMATATLRTDRNKYRTMPPHHTKQTLPTTRAVVPRFAQHERSLRYGHDVRFMPCCYPGLSRLPCSCTLPSCALFYRRTWFSWFCVVSARHMRRTPHHALPYPMYLPLGFRSVTTPVTSNKALYAQHQTVGCYLRRVVMDLWLLMPHLPLSRPCR